ncbi:MAG TPA: protein kinase [Vicinamibacterales bacterium]|nr:protein kinase [Vicinamibacterales bacterium]
MIGQTVSHYRIVERLGAGGMGVVYKAEDTRLKRTVALKFLPVELTQDREARERLQLEAQAASALDHPNICTIFEVDDSADGRVFVAMSFYEGESLAERIGDGPLPVAEGIRVGIGIARGLAAAHEAGVFHRDIKPANLMLTKRGEVKIVDFGVAKQIDRTELTRTGVTVGTIAYMAPEYVLGQSADAQTEVWALGVVLYEMLAGCRPFDGDHSVAIMNAIANREPRPLRELRPDAPAELDAIVMRALEKPRGTRYQSVREMQQALESVQQALTLRPSATATSTQAIAPGAKRWSRGAIGAALAVGVALVAVGSWWVVRSQRLRDARQEIAQMRTLTEEEKYTQAYRLMRGLEPSLAGDKEFETAKEMLLLPAEVQTVPEGAEVFLKGYDEPDAEWLPLGRSPLNLRLPLGYFRVRVVKAGFTTFEGSGEGGMTKKIYTLSPEGSLPEGMVFVPDTTRLLSGIGPVAIPSFAIDQYEVTNRQFKAFVDAGGYTKAEFWREPFVNDGRTLTWQEGMSVLRDTTGQPSPATWELRAYPAGQDNYPVTGVSWYEALAYAVWTGRELPTIHHWKAAASSDGGFSIILEFSNFSNKQIAAVGAYQGIGPFGTFDMAGNAREWSTNAVGSRRYILGGGWNQPNYLYPQSDAVDPFDRSAINGFRTITRTSATPVPEPLLRPVEVIARDYSREKPVSDQDFEAFRRQYAYDRDELKAAVESTDESHELWRVERVSYAAAYGGERITAYLFLPRKGAAPFQTVVYFPHSGGEYLRSFQQSEMNYLGFVLRSGRALLFPMYKGTYERRLDQMPAGMNGRRDLVINRMKDLQRSVDYLLTRSDIDHDRLGFFGVSLGGRLGPIALAIEKRFKTGVLWSGGFRTTLTQVAPEIDEINFAPRVTTPVLMLNGEQDFTFPVETSQKPMFRLFGTPAADKQHVIYDGGHVFPFARIIKNTLDWLDRYLGPVKF